MPPLRDPERLKAYCDAVANWRFKGFVSFELNETAYRWLRTELDNVSTETIARLMAGFVAAGGEIDEVRETREVWQDDYDYHYDLRFAVQGNEVYIENPFALLPAVQTRRVRDLGGKHPCPVIKNRSLDRGSRNVSSHGDVPSAVKRPSTSRELNTRRQFGMTDACIHLRFQSLKSQSADLAERRSLPRRWINKSLPRFELMPVCCYQGRFAMQFGELGRTRKRFQSIWGWRKSRYRDG